MAPLRRVTLLCACLASPSLAAPATPRQRLRCKTTVAAGDGSFTIELRPDWAPKGVERVLALQKAGFFDDMPFFRAIQNFLIQFGLSPDRQKHTDWLRAGAHRSLTRTRTRSRTRTRARALTHGTASGSSPPPRRSLARTHSAAPPRAWGRRRHPRRHCARPRSPRPSPRRATSSLSVRSTRPSRGATTRQQWWW